MGKPQCACGEPMELITVELTTDTLIFYVCNRCGQEVYAYSVDRQPKPEAYNG